MGLKEILEQSKARLELEIAKIKEELVKLAGTKKVVHVYAILDKSGSMASLTSDTIGGFNSFIAKQRADQSTELLVTLVQFASPDYIVNGTRFKGDYEASVREQPIAEVRELTTKDYIANGGSTALNDAIGKTLTGINIKADDAYVVLVITDGYENDSREFKVHQVRDLIKSFEAKDNFTFVFIGSDPSTWNSAESYGTSRANTMSYSPDSAGVAASYTTASRGLSAMRSSVSSGGALSTQNFVDLDKLNLNITGANATATPPAPTIVTNSAAPVTPIEPTT